MNGHTNSVNGLDFIFGLYSRRNQKLQFTANNYILILCSDFNFDYDGCNGQRDGLKTLLFYPTMLSCPATPQ